MPLITNLQNKTDAKKLSIRRVTLVISPVIRWPRDESNHLPASSAKVKVE
jgi:hypothetical protein